MLTIQTGFKTDLESNRSIFVLYVSNGEQTFNCALDYDLIKNAHNAQQLYNNISPALLHLIKSCYPDKQQGEPKHISDDEENRINDLIKKSAEEGLNHEEKDELCNLLSKKSGLKKPQEVKEPEENKPLEEPKPEGETLQ